LTDFQEKKTIFSAKISENGDYNIDPRTAAYGNVTGHHRKKNKLRNIQDDMDPDYRYKRVKKTYSKKSDSAYDLEFATTTPAL
jgi:hypothetical protein